MMASSSIALRVEGVSKSFDRGSGPQVVALRDVTIDVAQGSFVSVIGSNGSGKSTLLNVIAGAVVPSSGKVCLCGKDVTRIQEYKRARLVARVFQEPMLGVAPHLSVAENLALALNRGRRHRLIFAVTKRRMQQFRNLVSELDMGLEDRLGQEAGTLSGGERQALSVVMAYMTGPEIVLLDEHCASLDPVMARLVMRVTARHATSKHVTTVMVTHNVQDAIDYGDRILVIHQGMIVGDVTGSDKKQMSIDSVLSFFQKGNGRGTVGLGSLL